MRASAGRGELPMRQRGQTTSPASSIHRMTRARALFSNERSGADSLLEAPMTLASRSKIAVAIASALLLGGLVSSLDARAADHGTGVVQLVQAAPGRVDTAERT